MRGLVVEPVPRPMYRRGGGDDEVPFGVRLVIDGFVEARHDDGADAVRAALLDWGAADRVEVDLGLVVGTHGGEAGRLTGRHAAGPVGGDHLV